MGQCFGRRRTARAIQCTDGTGPDDVKPIRPVISPAIPDLLPHTNESVFSIHYDQFHHDQENAEPLERHNPYG